MIEARSQQGYPTFDSLTLVQGRHTHINVSRLTLQIVRETLRKPKIVIFVSIAVI